MAKFRSKRPVLVLQDDDGVWAEFVDHEFETTDKKVIARLKSVDDVEASGKDDSASDEN